MHGLQAPVDVALEHHLAEHLDLGGFVLLLQREIGLLPVGPDAPALEALHLAIHLLAGVSSGFLAQLDRRQRLALFLIHRLQHLEFDRQAVAVPTRHVAHPAALQHLIFVDHIFEHLVQGMAHVQGTVGVGRPVVKREGGPAVVEPQLPIDAVLAPEGLQFRLPLHRIGTHAKACLQQVERVLVGGTSLGGVAGLLAHVGAAATGIIRLRWVGLRLLRQARSVPVLFDQALQRSLLRCSLLQLWRLGRPRLAVRA